jgi:hypothetical protein
VFKLDFAEHFHAITSSVYLTAHLPELVYQLPKRVTAVAVHLARKDEFLNHGSRHAATALRG